MKLQCSCGAKYAFDAKPDMLQNPVKFICPSCGLDSSDFVNQLIRQEFGGQTPPPIPAAATPPAPPPVPVSSAGPPPPPPPPAASRLRVSVGAPEAPAAEPREESKFCPKHRERNTEKCAVCHKPICPKCLELFGFFCSPLCKGKAEAQHLDVPAYAARKDLVEADCWRKTGLVAGVIGLVVVLFLGGWIWYAWFGSVPHPYYSVRFEDSDRGYAGAALLVGKDQLVYLHGGTLARVDLKTKQPVWTKELITPQQIADAVKTANEAEAKLNEERGFQGHHSEGATERTMKQALQAALTLRVSGQNIWVSNGEKLTRYDWASGQEGNAVALPENGGEMVETGDELQFIGEQSVIHISLASGESRVEQIGPAGAASGLAHAEGGGGGLPGVGNYQGQALDPQKVEAQAQNLKLQGRLALPALIGNARHEAQIEAALRDDLPRKHAQGLKTGPEPEQFQLVAGKTGFMQFSTRLLEEKFVERSAMKAAPKKSALDGDVNAANSGKIANELLNEMQRNAGGGTVTEDMSRYQVTVHSPDGSSPDWTSEVVGPPQLFVLQTVNVVTAGKGLVVLDKSNKKVWEATLTYPVPEHSSGLFSRRDLSYGDGPCVEHGDTLYVFDQAVLTAYDLASGNARWRLPSVGVVGLFFDDQGGIYVNTTTGNPEDIKYSRQIDINRRTENVVSKIESKTGRTLWSAKPGGFVSYLSGQFIYVIESYDPNPTDEDVLSDMTIQKPAYLRITRIRPKDGKIMWDYYDRDRCPVTWNFDGNSIQLVFKREVQVLRYLTF